MATQLKEGWTRAEEERHTRVDLAAAHRLAYRYGWNYGIYNHFTHTVPGHSDRFLVKPHGVLMSEVTASNLIVVDNDGNTVHGDGEVETTALHIHAAIHSEVPSATCVLHIHPPYATWLTSIRNNRLQMVNQNSTRFFNRIAYDDDYAGLAVAREEGLRMVKALGNHRIMLHANHGVTTVGPSVADAMCELYNIERCCKEYYDIVASGQEPRIIPDEVCESACAQMEKIRDEEVALSFDAWKRMLDREEPDYAH